MSEPMNR